jgi:hypothetical protein
VDKNNSQDPVYKDTYSSVHMTSAHFVSVGVIACAAMLAASVLAYVIYRFRADKLTAYVSLDGASDADRSDELPMSALNQKSPLAISSKRMYGVH